jgi:hypothetical protein
MRRCSSREGPRPAPFRLIASSTRTTPVAVVKVVSSTFVPGRYRRDVSNPVAGISVKQPPLSASSRAPKTLGESRSGRVNQSTEASSATSAIVRPSPIAA